MGSRVSSDAGDPIFMPMAGFPHHDRETSIVSVVKFPGFKILLTRDKWANSSNHITIVSHQKLR